MILYVHGAGRVGSDAWPGADAARSLFTRLPSTASTAQRTDEVVRLLGSRDAPRTVVAHSVGAIPAVLSLARTTAAGRAPVDRLVLVEPALYDVARGEPAVERHIGTMERARARLAEDDLRGYWEVVRPLMFGGAPDPARWDAERARAAAFAEVTPPWGHGIDASAISAVPTLVVTGGWNAEYEAIARALGGAGAEHHVVEGAGHRPQDVPGFAELLGAWSAPGS